MLKLDLPFMQSIHLCWDPQGPQSAPVFFTHYFRNPYRASAPFNNAHKIKTLKSWVILCRLSLKEQVGLIMLMLRNLYRYGEASRYLKLVVAPRLIKHTGVAR